MEKVYYLLNILEQILDNPFLRERLVLKGGIALNLFCFDSIPRLSVDIDLNYIGSTPKLEIERTIVILSHFGAILCQRFADLNSWRKLKDQHEMLVYGSFFGDSEADKTFSNSLCRLSDLENFIEILQKKKLNAKPQQQRIFKNQLKNLDYALKSFSFAPDSKNFGQTFFKPSFRPRLPELDNFPVVAIKPYDENDTIFKASTLIQLG